MVGADGLIFMGSPFFEHKKASRHCREALILLERARGIEPPYLAWAANGRPLNYARTVVLDSSEVRRAGT